jgi:hypothetical protein
MKPKKSPTSVATSRVSMLTAGAAEAVRAKRAVEMRAAENFIMSEG